MATYWENSCSFGLRYVSWYKYLIVSLVFSHLGFWSGNLFLIAPFPDLCLLVPFRSIIKINQLREVRTLYPLAKLSNLNEAVILEQLCLQFFPTIKRSHKLNRWPDMIIYYHVRRFKIQEYHELSYEFLHILYQSQVDILSYSVNSLFV